MLQKIIKLLRETWFFWLFSIFLGFLNGRETEANPMPTRAELITGLAFPLLIAIWVSADARRRQRTIGYGFPALVFLLWPIFAPIYLFQTRGVRAFLSILAFFAMLVITACIGIGIGTLAQR